MLEYVHCIASHELLFFIGNTAQKNLDTAIDKGGPSRQFLSDSWNQIQTLAVPVLSGKVHIFKHDIAKEKRGAVLELIPLQDDYLIYRIEEIIGKENHDKKSPKFKAAVEDAKIRIYKYSRVVGRFLVGEMTFTYFTLIAIDLILMIPLSSQLHAFIRGYPVSSAVMTPFYMNRKTKTFYFVSSRPCSVH
jgi:hypothetical protein